MAVTPGSDSSSKAPKAAPSTTPWLIVGLGNPGDQYLFHRHNVGFMAIDFLVDHLAAQSGDPSFQKKFDGLTAKAELNGHKLILLKPQTFMNNSGRSVQKAAQFYKLPPENILVIHDEIDLEPGQIKSKIGGGHAGHNGLRDIDRCIGKNYWRLRVGVGHPGHKDRVHGHVLSNFAKQDQMWLDDFLAHVEDTIENIINQAAAGGA